MFCKYKVEGDPAPAPQSVLMEKKPERDTRFRVEDRGEHAWQVGVRRYHIIRSELVWQEKEHALTDDKDAADKIAALLNGGGA